ARHDSTTGRARHEPPRGGPGVDLAAHRGERQRVVGAAHGDVAAGAGRLEGAVRALDLDVAAHGLEPGRGDALNLEAAAGARGVDPAPRAAHRDVAARGLELLRAREALGLQIPAGRN